MEEENKTIEEVKTEPVETSDNVLDQIIEEAEEFTEKEENNVDKKENTKDKAPKKKIIIFIIICILVIGVGAGFAYYFLHESKEDPIQVVEDILPLPELTGGERGQLGIDKNINESTIDRYLNREDTVYRDMRMLEDPADYESIGGDRFLSGYIEGFEIVSLPYIIPVNDLPETVGSTYNGTTLFRYENGTYIANYEQSISIIESLFPKDKYIFLMCGGGGYAGMMKKFLIALGWDENKIYNIGGYWYYHGEHNIKIKKEVNGEFTYDFDLLTYHDINFKSLTPLADYKYDAKPLEELKFTDSKIELLENKSYYLTYVRLPAGSDYTEVSFKSDNTNVATVSEYGLLIAKSAGTATITVYSKENETIKGTCTVVVKSKPIVEKTVLDDISSEAKEFYSYDLDQLNNAFNKKTSDENGIKEGYYNWSPQGYKITNDKYDLEYQELEKSIENAYTNRLRILNELTDSKKSFIIIQYTNTCDYKDFEIHDSARKVLDSYEIPYLYIYNNGSNDAYRESNIDLNQSGVSESSIVIVKNGEIEEYIDANVYSFSYDKETEEWLRTFVKFPDEA